MALVESEDDTELFLEVRNVVAVSLLPKAPETVEILPDLGGGKPHILGKGAGRHALHSALVQFVDISVIFGKASDNGHRYVLSVHIRPPIT
jgi:hypothetical protein